MALIDAWMRALSTRFQSARWHSLVAVTIGEDQQDKISDRFPPALTGQRANLQPAFKIS